MTAIYIPISVYSGNIPHSIMELMKQLLFDGTFLSFMVFPRCGYWVYSPCLFDKKINSGSGLLSIIAYVIGIFGDSYYGIIENVPFLHTLYNGIFFVSSYTRNGIFLPQFIFCLGCSLLFPNFIVGKTYVNGGLCCHRCSCC